jgi:RNA-directed DNA polymerase
VSAVTARSTLAAVGSDRARALQHALYRAAKADPTRRFHALFDKVYRSDVLERAWEQVRRNRGAAGIDRITLRTTQLLPQQGFRRWASTRPVTENFPSPHW